MDFWCKPPQRKLRKRGRDRYRRGEGYEYDGDHNGDSESYTHDRNRHHHHHHHDRYNHYLSRSHSWRPSANTTTNTIFDTDGFPRPVYYDRPRSHSSHQGPLGSRPRSRSEATAYDYYPRDHYHHQHRDDGYVTEAQSDIEAHRVRHAGYSMGSRGRVEEGKGEEEEEEERERRRRRGGDEGSNHPDYRSGRTRVRPQDYQDSRSGFRTDDYFRHRARERVASEGRRGEEVVAVERREDYYLPPRRAYSTSSRYHAADGGGGAVSDGSSAVEDYDGVSRRHFYPQHRSYRNQAYTVNSSSSSSSLSYPGYLPSRSVPLQQGGSRSSSDDHSHHHRHAHQHSQQERSTRLFHVVDMGCHDQQRQHQPTPSSNTERRRVHFADPIAWSIDDDDNDDFNDQNRQSCYSTSSRHDHPRPRHHSYSSSPGYVPPILRHPTTAEEKTPPPPSKEDDAKDKDKKKHACKQTLDRVAIPLAVGIGIMVGIGLGE